MCATDEQADLVPLCSRSLLAERAMQTWIIGSRTPCDIVVDSPGVSGRHCRLTSTPDGYILEDLGSTNGTHVNGMRITTSCRVTRQDTITLGLTTLLPWPAEPSSPRAVVLSIGREPDNDFVIDLLMVSCHHARVIWNGEPGQATIEDLGSSNGTAVGSPDEKITRATFTSSDTIYLGSYAVPAAQILARIDRSQAPALAFRGQSMLVGRDPACDLVIDLPMVSSRHVLLSRRDGQVLIKDLGSSNGTFVNGRRIEGETTVYNGDLIALGSHTLALAIESPGAIRAILPTAALIPPPMPARPSGAPAAAKPLEAALSQELGAALQPPWRLPALLVQALLLGIVIALVFKASPPVPNDPASTKAAAGAIASILFWVSLAAIWFGLANALFGNLLDREIIRAGLSPDGASALVTRAVILVVLGGFECALAWLAAASIAGLLAPSAQAIGLLTLASAVGLALGLLIVSLAPGRAPAWGVVAVAVIMLWLFGAPAAQLWKSPVTGIIANALPSRWAFEGLLLLESDRHDPTVLSESSSEPNADIAESYFPAASERMGPKADAMALTLMFVGLALGTAFISAAGKLGP
jgi:pSer/pThr/pTyr-binding forkhead associated (FHA) protein